MTCIRKIDPELEKLRNEIDGPPNLDTVVLSIQRSTSKIHAGYLFENVGKPLLQQLCLLLSATGTNKIYNGWQEFAAQIGLMTEQIRCIDYDFKGSQGGAYYVLLAYVQLPEATLNKVFDALQKINRLDIINQVKDYTYDLIKAIQIDTHTDASIIHRPEHIPRVPLILSPILKIKDKDERINTDHTSEEGSQESVITVSRNVETKRPYGSVVMLTFANDGIATAQHITKVFRSKPQKIGVLILQEQEKYVYSRAEEFIDDCFNQVDYIIPILTKEYLKQINNPLKTYSDQQNKLDTKYLKYIYSLLRYEYIKHNCCNNRVRCIVPDKEVYTIVQANTHPTLQVWFKESDIDSFADSILSRKL